MTAFANVLQTKPLRGFGRFDRTFDVPRLTWTVGDVVRKEREAQRLGIKDLALKAGVDRMRLSALEKGENFEQKTLEKVALALRRSVPQLHAEVPPKEWPIGDEYEAWLLYRGIKDPADRRQALEHIERLSSVKRADIEPIAGAL